MAFRSLYLHFPFCETKCHYCDFYSLGASRTKADDPALFERALTREIEMHASALAPELDTVFLGGGTPSMTPPASMLHALEHLWRHTRLTPETEWTMEANPSSVSTAALREYRKLGVNRVSFGVQSLRDETLLMLGRVHSREKALAALNATFEAGLENVSCDLLCGVPGQTLADLEEALTTLSSFPIKHLSCYLLTLPPHHKMYGQLPDEDTQLKNLLFVHEWMTAHGFEHYEISNFARPGYRARHNLNYWTGRSYLGFGPSAHSFDAQAQRRFKNVSSLHKYAELVLAGKSAQEWEEILSPAQRELEKWMLALRLDQGFPRDWLDTDTRRRKAAALEARGLLEPREATHLRLTARGFALSDQVIKELA